MAWLPRPQGSLSNREEAELPGKPGQSRLMNWAWAWRYDLAILLVAVALLAAVTMRPLGKNIPIHAPFFLAIMIAIWFGGTRVGILTVILSILAVDYFLVPPLYSFTINPEDLPSFAAFVIVAILMGWFSAVRERAEQALRAARMLLESKVEERTAELRRANAALQSEMEARKRAQQAIEKTRAELAHTTRVTTLGELTASIAHEVNQPLAVMVASANASLRWLNGDSPDLEKSRKAIERIVSEGHRASEIVERIRTFVNKSQSVRSELDLNGILEEVVALVRHDLEVRGIAVRLDLGTNLSKILGDRIQLQQVFLNLVVNAMEAMEPVTDRAKELVIRSENREGKEVLIAIEDTGIGFASLDVDRMFSAFYTTKAKGMGMGLAISRTIVEAHGGRVRALAHQPRGAVLEVALPLKMGT